MNIANLRLCRYFKGIHFASSRLFRSFVSFGSSKINLAALACICSKHSSFAGVQVPQIDIQYITDGMTIEFYKIAVLMFQVVNMRVFLSGLTYY